MNKKILAVALTTVLSSAAFAATETFNATVLPFSEPTISEDAAGALNFGSIGLSVASACTMADDATVSGNCDSGSADLNIGIINIEGVVANTGYSIEVTGGAGTNVSFVSEWDVESGVTGTAPTGVADDTVTNVTSTAAADDIVLNVYGVLTVDTALTSGGAAETAPYTVEVLFQ